MVKFQLELSCQAENVKEFGAHGEDFRYYLKIKCSQCGEVPEKFHYICAAETVQARTGRSTVNQLGKCKSCSREYTISILPETIKPYVVDDSKTEDYQAVAEFEVRGCELSEFEPRKGWRVLSAESSTEFLDVDLSEGDWADYDERAGVSVTIMELTSRFTKA